MDKIELGQTGIKISPIGLGTVKFGRKEGVKYPEKFDIPSEESLHNLLARAQNLGINMLDTAPAYGKSEERLGILLQKTRKDWVIIGKAGEEFENGKSEYIFTPDHFKMSLERSLKRLKTDYLDILLIHSNGEDAKILSDNALIKTMHEFKSQGLVRAIGASTKTSYGGLKTLELMDVVMATYTQEYTEEKPVLDYAQQHQKGLILKKILSSGHNTDIQAAMNFAFAHKGVCAAIIGTINPDHMDQNIRFALKSLQARSRVPV